MIVKSTVSVILLPTTRFHQSRSAAVSKLNTLNEVIRRMQLELRASRGHISDSWWQGEKDFSDWLACLSTVPLYQVFTFPKKHLTGPKSKVAIMSAASDEVHPTTGVAPVGILLDHPHGNLDGLMKKLRK